MFVRFSIDGGEKTSYDSYHYEVLLFNPNLVKKES